MRSIFFTPSLSASAPRRGWLLIGTITLFVFVVNRLFISPKLPLEKWLQWESVTLVALAPFLALAIWRGKPSGWHDIGLVLGVEAMNFACLAFVRNSILGVFVAPQLHWNWMGKLSAIAASLVFIALWRGISWREIGFTWLRKDSWIPFIALEFLIVAITLFLPKVAIILFLPITDAPVKVEELLFQLTMPAIDEEILFRGIMLALLNRTFGTPWKVLGANVGWGWIISSIYFVLVHLHGLDSSQIQFYFFVSLIGVMVKGFLLGWLRERTGSLYPAMLFHSTLNATNLVINAIAHGLA